MANPLMEQYLPAGMTRDKYASAKQDKFYADIKAQAENTNKLMAAEDPANWSRTAQLAYGQHVQQSGGQPLPPAEWKRQNANLFIE